MGQATDSKRTGSQALGKSMPAEVFGLVEISAFRSRRVLDHRALWQFRINAFDESGSVGVGPVGILRLKFGADLLSGLIGGHALALEGQRSRADSRDQVNLGRHQ